MLPVENQLDDGSCVAFTVKNLKDLQETEEQPGHPGLSAEFVYLKTLQIEGRLSDPEGGLFLRDALRLVQSEGICLDKEWPYKPHNRDISPASNEEIIASALTHCIDKYAGMNTINEIKLALYNNGIGNPVALGVPAYTPWFSAEAMRTGIVPNSTKGSLEGGHAICLCGWAEYKTKELLVFENSWGEEYAPESRWHAGFGGIYSDYVERFLDDDEADAWTTTDRIGKGTKLVN